MTICLELGKEEDEVRHWAPERLERWMAFFIVREEETQRRAEQKRRSGR
jgi:hypothetical protein